MLPFVPASWHVNDSCVTRMCLNQIVGNGSEQQLQRELEDVLMDPSVADTGLGPEAGMDGHDIPASMASPAEPGTDPLTSPLSKLEMALPVQTAQESELNERSYRGELKWDFSYSVSTHTNQPVICRSCNQNTGKSLKSHKTSTHYV